MVVVRVSESTAFANFPGQYARMGLHQQRLLKNASAVLQFALPDNSVLTMRTNASMNPKQSVKLMKWRRRNVCVRQIATAVWVRHVYHACRGITALDGDNYKINKESTLSIVLTLISIDTLSLWAKRKRQLITFRHVVISFTVAQVGT